MVERDPNDMDTNMVFNDLRALNHEGPVHFPAEALTCEDLTKEYRDDLFAYFTLFGYEYGTYNCKFFSDYYLDDIKGVDKFYRGKCKKKNCFKEGNLGCEYIISNLFSSFKEGYFGNRKELRKLQEQDFQGIEEFSKILVIEGPENISKMTIFKEIRSAIEHDKVACYGKDYLLIDNPANPPKHAINFKAFVPYNSLIGIMFKVNRINRRLTKYFFDTSGIAQLPKKHYTYDEIKDLLVFKVRMLKNSLNSPIDPDTGEILSDESLSSDDYEVNEVKLSDLQKKMLEDFFSSGHVDIVQLRYAASNMVDHNIDEYHFNLMYRFLAELGGDCTYQDFVDKTCNISLDSLLERYKKKFSASEDELKVLKPILDKLPGVRQKNGQPLIWHLYGIVDYAKKCLFNQGFLYDSENKLFIKGNIKITARGLTDLTSRIYENGYKLHNLIDLFPIRLKLQFLKNYCSIWGGTSDEYETYVDKDGNTKTKLKICLAERIRDAFTHNQYTLLNGVNYLLLRDGYDKRTGTWEREEKYNINQLYNYIASKFSKLNKKKKKK